MRLVVDGVFFQLANTGIARVWSTLLPRLAARPDLDVVLLDRGGAPTLETIRSLPFPAYTSTSTAADSFLLEQFCQDLGADVFCSTYYTTPVSTPSVMLVYDMIPEVFGHDMNLRQWREKEIAICHASRLGCISNQTKLDLCRIYPEIALDRIQVTHCGVDRDVFRPVPAVEIDAFRQAYALDRPYFMMVGSRNQLKGYKNGPHVFEAARQWSGEPLLILCVGGEPTISEDSLAGLPDTVSVRRVELSDRELCQAYGGAEALLYPSLYEGFGLPALEAMASGCPVITTRHGSLDEVIGDAGFIVSGHDAAETAFAMRAVREPETRRLLIEAGLRRAGLFSWDDMADQVHALLLAAVAERSAEASAAFFREWERLRLLQMRVDTLL